MEALYVAILCASYGLECPLNADPREAYTMTREHCLAVMQRERQTLFNYEGYCVQWGGKEIIDHAGRVNDLSHATSYASPPAGYTGVRSDPALIERLIDSYAKSAEAR
jgi:hypothetical protein